MLGAVSVDDQSLLEHGQRTVAGPVASVAILGQDSPSSAWTPSHAVQNSRH